MEDLFKGKQYNVEIEWGKLHIYDINSSREILSVSSSSLENVTIRSNIVRIYSTLSRYVDVEFEYPSDAQKLYEKLSKDSKGIYAADVDKQYVYIYDRKWDRNFHYDYKISLKNVKEVYSDGKNLVIVDGELRYSPKTYSFEFYSSQEVDKVVKNIKSNICENKDSTNGYAIVSEQKKIKNSTSSQQTKKSHKWIPVVVVLLVIGAIGSALEEKPSGNVSTANSYLYYVETLESMNVRTGPSTSNSATRVIPKGTECKVYQEVNAENYLWYCIGNNEWIADNGTWDIKYNNCAYVGSKQRVLNTIFANCQQYGIANEYTQHHSYWHPDGFEWFWLVLERDQSTYDVGLIISSGGDVWMEWNGKLKLTDVDTCYITPNVGISDDEFINYLGSFPLYNVGE